MQDADTLFWLKEAKPEFEAEMHRSLSFWVQRMKDTVNDGFYGRIDGLNQLYPKADKSVILNTRILWTFSHIARYTSNKTYHEMARRAYDYIINHFIDKNFGGVYWMVDYKGQPLNRRKQLYAQAFAIYALSEYYLCSKDEKSLDWAKDIFRHIEHYSFDALKNGYMEACTEQWGEIDDLRLSEKDANEKKTMNTHLHVLEAYTNLYRVWQDEELARQLRNLLLLFFERFINYNGHLELFFDENWNLKSSEISFGHDIECSWLLCEAAEVLNDKIFIEKARGTAVKMVDAVMKEGVHTDGALMNKVDNNGIMDSDKHWWPQAEALVGFINAWEINPDPKYIEALKNNWKFIKKTLLDKEDGEWHWRSNKIGTIIKSEDKAGPWKCPYHNNRAMMELIRRIEHLK
ncbi:AGE family epimerase/isomerase [Fulvivirga sp. 2943]|uniref:Cellobiose 2-epimerase n=2 Tax=Fulvivirga sediminis TaxID=2803949 RepID=A0A937F4T9_9BACT|nr:AGE family epimerase/isomerase [Fulvivirga sediminis]